MTGWPSSTRCRQRVADGLLLRGLVQQPRAHQHHHHHDRRRHGGGQQPVGSGAAADLALAYAQREGDGRQRLDEGGAVIPDRRL
jgi:hypothetical protein